MRELLNYLVLVLVTLQVAKAYRCLSHDKDTEAGRDSCRDYYLIKRDECQNGYQFLQKTEFMNEIVFLFNIPVEDGCMIEPTGLYKIEDGNEIKSVTESSQVMRTKSGRGRRYCFYGKEGYFNLLNLRDKTTLVKMNGDTFEFNDSDTTGIPVNQAFYSYCTGEEAFSTETNNDCSECEYFNTVDYTICLDKYKEDFKRDDQIIGELMKNNSVDDLRVLGGDPAKMVKNLRSYVTSELCVDYFNTVEACNGMGRLITRFYDLPAFGINLECKPVEDLDDFCNSESTTKASTTECPVCPVYSCPSPTTVSTTNLPCSCPTTEPYSSPGISKSVGPFSPSSTQTGTYTSTTCPACPNCTSICSTPLQGSQENSSGTSTTLETTTLIVPNTSYSTPASISQSRSSTLITTTIGLDLENITIMELENGQNSSTERMDNNTFCYEEIDWSLGCTQGRVITNKDNKLLLVKFCKGSGTLDYWNSKELMGIILRGNLYVVYCVVITLLVLFMLLFIISLFFCVLNERNRKTERDEIQFDSL